MKIIPLPIRESELPCLAEIDASLEETAEVREARLRLSRFGSSSEEIVRTTRDYLKSSESLMREYRMIFYNKVKSSWNKSTL